MYVTGGIGSSGDNEGFTRDFDLPNHTAYCETCASCALIFWGDEMLRLTGDSEYADVIELALFNNVLAGISPQGDRYFYANPLESRGEHARVPWFGCACCPANAARTIARVEEWAIRTAADAGNATASVDFPVPGTTRIGDVELEITGDYPATGAWTLRVRAPRPTPFTLGLRIPGWANDVEIDTPDELGEAEYRSGYAVFERDWTGETVIKIDWPMPPVWLAADPRVVDNAGRLALQKGPTVYALVRGGSPVAPQRLQIDPEPEVVERTDRLEVEALYEPQDQPDLLYALYEPKDPEEITATFVPYRDWANDGRTEMLVWARKL
ncbi:MAG: glycoside hydrolase family 127 protein [Propionibacteriaceae bacterium]|nr:MAG: glycoside hydrolase family 127 protein [Propionibacteriaceae bacterium]